jgi:hypothetical protein
LNIGESIFLIELTVQRGEMDFVISALDIPLWTSVDFFIELTVQRGKTDFVISALDSPLWTSVDCFSKRSIKMI